MEPFKPITKFEPLPGNIVSFLYKYGRFIISGKIDEEFGCGVVDFDTKAVWTKDGRRIEAQLLRTPGGGFIIAQSKNVDPLYTERKVRK